MSMVNRLSAGILFYRKRNDILEFLLVHPGGPYYTRKDEGYWSIPKGGPEQGESLQEAALREVEEELGVAVPRQDALVPLGTIVQKGGKVVHGWAMELTSLQPRWDLAQKFALEWPPQSGRTEQFLEVDRAEYFAWPEAARKIKSAQVPFLQRLAEHLGIALET